LGKSLRPTIKKQEGKFNNSMMDKNGLNFKDKDKDSIK